MTFISDQHVVCMCLLGRPITISCVGGAACSALRPAAFSGRALSSSHHSHFIFTICTHSPALGCVTAPLMPPSSLLCVSSAEYFHPLITAFTVLVFVNTVYPLFRCAFTEPGIVPRNTRFVPCSPPLRVLPCGERLTCCNAMRALCCAQWCGAARSDRRVRRR